MPVSVQAPNGDTVQFPDGTDDATINSVMAKEYGGAAQAPAAGQGPQGAQPNAGQQPPVQAPPNAGVGSAALSFAKAVDQPLDNLSIMLSKVPGFKTIDQLAGPEHTAQAVADSHARYFQDAQQHGYNVDEKVPGFAGSVLGIAPLAAVTENPFAGGALAGAATTKDPNDPVGTAVDAASGAVFGKAAQWGLNRAAGVINPIVRPYVQRLLDSGMERFTPGQLFGGTTQLAEQGLRYLPVLGDVVHGAQDRTLSDFNSAAYNTALKDIGGALPKGVTGHDAATYTQQAISSQFQKIYPTLRVQADGRFRQDMGDLATEVRQGGLPADKQHAFFTYMQGIGRRFSGSGGMTGRTMGEVDSLLGEEYRNYRGSSNPDDQKFAKYLLMAQDNLRQMVYRSNPNQAPALQAARSAWAKFVPTELAASGAGTDAAGRFQPQDLKTAAAQEGTRRQMAQGRATMQPHAEAGQAVIGNVRPPTLMNRLIGGGLGVGAIMAHANPMLAIPYAAMSFPYTEAGQRLVTRMVTGRQGAPYAQVGGALRTAARSALPGVVGGAAAPKRPSRAQQQQESEEMDLGVTGR